MELTVYTGTGVLYKYHEEEYTEEYSVHYMVNDTK